MTDKTVEETIKSLLIEHGLFEKEADEVIGELKNRVENRSVRWNEAHNAYPDTVIWALSLNAKAEAVRWIDTNCPQHWARGMLR